MIEPGPFGHIHPEDQPAAKHAAARGFWTGVPQVMRHRLRQPDGTYRWSEMRTAPAYGASVPVEALVSEQERSMSSGHDLSAAGNLDPIQAAKVVEELFGNGWAFDATGRWTYLPMFAQTTLGKTPDELNCSVPEGDVAWKQLLHPDEYEAVAEKWTHSLRTGDPFNAEFRIRRESGFAWARSSARAGCDERGQITGWYGTSIDIDVHRKTVAALQERENSLSHLVDLVPCHLWRLNADGEPTFFNKRMVDYLGWDIADADEADRRRLDAIFDTIHPGDADDVRAALNESLATGQSFASRYRVRRADGVFRWKSVHAEQMKDQDGRVAQWYGMCLDIDDHIRAEEARQLSERHLQRVVDALPINIASWTATGEVTYANSTFVEALGVPHVTFEVVFAAVLALVHPEDVERFRKTVTQGLRAGDAFVVRYRRSVDGAFRWREARFEPRRDLNGAVAEWFALAIDVDDDVRMQEALSLAQANLARASQAATLAELSASIAHEVTQPLTAVSMSSDACRRWLSMDPPNIERALMALEGIQGGANRASDVVTRIRSLFKHSIDGRTTTALGAVIDETCGLLAEEAAHRRVRIDLEIDDELPLFAFDRVQVQQILINLIRNGMQAMEAVADNKILGLHAFRAGEMVQVEISDTGPGIEAPDMIFQPFFTTKSEGLGMGLAICRSIVESHSGCLWVEQGNPNGARFVFTLPVNAPDP